MKLPPRYRMTQERLGPALTSLENSAFIDADLRKESDLVSG